MNSIEFPDEFMQTVREIYDTIAVLVDEAVQEMTKWLEPFIDAVSNWFASLPLSVQQFLIHYPSREYLIAILDDGET